MSNLNELIERRKQINEDIQNASQGITDLKEIVQQALEENHFKLANQISGTLYRLSQQLTIMLEQNVTKKEAKAIIEAQKEQAA